MNSKGIDRKAVGLLAASLLVGLSGTARADEPKFQFDKAEKLEKTLWKASAQAGLLLATGNANALTVSAGGSLLRNDGKNKFALDVDGRFGRVTTYAANDVNGNQKIDSYDEIKTDTKVNTQFWAVKLRYDRFFSANNLGYVSAQVMGDEPAGKRLFGCAQIGYSRQVVKTDRNELLAELGYDFTFVQFANPPTGGPDQLLIHSLRGFLGYGLTLSKDTALSAALEGLFNLNSLNAPGYADPVGAFGDIRVNFKTALTTKLHKNISFRFAFTTRFDNVPAPRNALSLPYTDGFVPLAEKVDTLSEASLIVNFL